MLQNIREKSGSKIAYILLGVLVFVFSFFGINSYFVASVDDSIATAGEIKISVTKYRERLNRQRSQMQAMMGESYNPRMFDTPEFKRNVLDRLIDEELLKAAGGAAGVAVSDSHLREEIKRQVPSAFIGDKFDAEMYKSILRNANYTPQGFETELRDNIASNLLAGRVSSTAQTSDAELDRYLALNDQTRDFRYVQLNRPSIDGSTISDDEIKKYYDAHLADLNNEETVALEYVELNLANQPMPPAPAEQELRETYERELSRFGSVEARLASHLLIQVAETASADEVKKAQARAADLLAQIRAGKDFAELAKANSDDIGSKEAGGDLGWIEKPDFANAEIRPIFEPAFIDGLFGLAVNAVSEPIKTAQGFHLVQLREIRPAAVKPFEEVSGELAQEAIQALREQRFAELEDAMLDAAAVAVGGLQDVAKAAGATVQQVPAFPKGFGFGIAANPEVAEFVFSDEAKLEGTVSDLIEIAPNHVVVVRVSEHKPRAPKTLEQAKEEIRAKLVQERIEKVAKDEADALLKRFVGGEALDAISASTGAIITVADAVGRQSIGHDSGLVKEVFKLPKPKSAEMPSRALAKTSDGRYALVELKAVKDGDTKKSDQAARDAAKQQLKGGLANADYDAFRQALRGSVEITIDESKL